ncbi:hypothetical protein N4T77_02760 [Clostridium sp. CX1]|uniref:hypothetical protein n=1 Tax=Clostridium sp. CX1 TaxID=2978346 RepID=UPI0021BE809C|nr:hypothetical protein [Clostridium sp. CX1]MCT8975512.1 hypothetical protein [Clostridium sp. CX1]
MKFYEFNDFDYYALIGAESEEDAVKYYRETVADVEEDDGPPSQITKEDARAKLLGGCREDEIEALKEFDIYTSRQEPYLVLIDGSLF